MYRKIITLFSHNTEIQSIGNIQISLLLNLEVHKVTRTLYGVNVNCRISYRETVLRHIPHLGVSARRLL
jgi:hypothetical protein